MRDQYIRTGQGFLLCFSVVSLTSFQAVTSFYERIMQVKECDVVPMVIVGTNSARALFFSPRVALMRDRQQGRSS